MTEIVFLFSADSDIQAAYSLYEEREQGRGDFFLRRLDETLGILRKFPEVGPTFLGRYRRLLVAGFPYAIFYSVEGLRLVISGVLDLRQDPSNIRKRLEP